MIWWTPSLLMPVYKLGIDTPLQQLTPVPIDMPRLDSVSVWCVLITITDRTAARSVHLETTKQDITIVIRKGIKFAWRDSVAVTVTEVSHCMPIVLYCVSQHYTTTLQLSQASFRGQLLQHSWSRLLHHHPTMTIQLLLRMSLGQLLTLPGIAFNLHHQQQALCSIAWLV